MTEERRCDSVWSPTEGVVHQCELREGHDGPHICCYKWYEEESGDVMS